MYNNEFQPNTNEELPASDIREKLNDGIVQCFEINDGEIRKSKMTGLFLLVEKSKLPKEQVESEIMNTFSRELGDGLFPTTFDLVVNDMRETGFVIDEKMKA